MSVRRAFETAVERLAGAGPAPVWLPRHLTVACVQVLPVAGATLSLFNDTGMPFPIGVSDAEAGAAEALQFTTAEGPCCEAWRTRQRVVADAMTLASCWPLFNHSLLTTTAFRAVVAVPLRLGMAGMGTLNLFVRDAADAHALAMTDVDTVNELVSERLWTSLARPNLCARGGEADLGPAWLHGVDASRRNAVFSAMGMLCENLSVTVVDALALLRARAFTTGHTVDRIAADIVELRLPAGSLNPFLPAPGRDSAS